MTISRHAAALALVLLAGAARAEDPNEAIERVMKEAVVRAAPWVVKVETAGGRELVGRGPAGPGGRLRKGLGPTTGVVLDPDGYVISSSFNFAHKPSDIFVTVPDHPRAVAKLIATDTSRQLALLKVDLTGLPVPAPVPKAEIRVGQWALALGRTLEPDAAGVPSVSVGIVSAVGRIWGRAIQTDAKVSPVNYGGPLIALDGRALGVLIPASPQSDSDAAGVEWYDSGVGFAVPMEDVFAVLPRLKQGRDVRRGLLGITVKQPDDQYLNPVTIATVAPESAAAKAGIQPGDRLVSLNGQPIANVAQMQFALGPKYEGDTVTVVINRDGTDIELGELTLSGAVTAFARPFLGVLPMRDDADAGVEVRFVYPDSPAEAVKLEEGDRITKFGPADAAELPTVRNREQLTAVTAQLLPGAEVKLEVRRKGGKRETLMTRLAVPPDAVPDLLPLPSTKRKATVRAKIDRPRDGEEETPADDERKPDAETGLIKRSDSVTGREWWAYVPPNYDRNVAHGVILWLHAAGRGGRDAQDVADIWKAFCQDHHFIVVGPQTKNPEGWLASETEEVVRLVKDVMGRYTVDRSRVVAHGMGVGGQMALYLGFASRDLIRGVATSGAALGGQPKDPVPTQPLAFFLVAGDKDPLVKEIIETRDKLTDRKFPVTYRELTDFGKEYLDTKTLDELQRWMDSLDLI